MGARSLGLRDAIVGDHKGRPYKLSSCTHNPFGTLAKRLQDGSWQRRMATRRLMGFGWDADPHSPA